MINHPHTIDDSQNRIVGLASDYLCAASEADRLAEAGRDNDRQEARKFGLLDDLALTPAVTARDFVTKITVHARLVGIEDGGGCQSVVEASLIRDARALLGASGA